MNTILLAVVLAISLIPVPSRAEEPKAKGGILELGQPPVVIPPAHPELMGKTIPGAVGLPEAPQEPAEKPRDGPKPPRR